MIRLRTGKLPGRVPFPQRNSEQTAPRRLISRANSWFSGDKAGQGCCPKQQSSARRRPPGAAVSGGINPRASPLTTVIPWAARPDASSRAISNPPGVTDRDPTTATAHWSSFWKSPV